MIIQDQKYYRNAGRLVYNDTVKKNVDIMIATSNARIKIQKNGMSMDPWDIVNTLSEEIIFPVLGDEVFRNTVRKIIESKRHE